MEPLRFIFSLFTVNDCINNIHQFIKPFLDNKMSIFEEYGAFKIHLYCIHCQLSLFIFCYFLMWEENIEPDEINLYLF